MGRVRRTRTGEETPGRSEKMPLDEPCLLGRVQLKAPETEDGSFADVDLAG